MNRQTGRLAFACVVSLLVLSIATTTATAKARKARAVDPVTCGQEITSDTKLTSNVGPCPGVGLIIAGDHVRLDLNRHTVFGDPQVRTADSAGILFRDVTRSSVVNGTVERFDAGVSIEGGSRNTVSGLLARDNINYRVVTGRDAASGSCDIGDGITASDSSFNRIKDNRAFHNGPFSGISVVGDSDFNTVMKNTVRDNDVVNLAPGATRPTICGTGVGPMQLGRQVQDIGIRVEGPGSNQNRILHNQVRRSALLGIAILPTLCTPPDNMPPRPNDSNVIASNTVAQTGLTTHTLDSVADGIAVLENGPAGIVCPPAFNTVRDNVSRGNFRDGIRIAGRGRGDNKVTGNQADNNAHDGLALLGPETPRSGPPLPGAINNLLNANEGMNNARFDGADFNLTPPCDNNRWRGSQFGKVNQSCVDPNATVFTPPPTP